MCPQYTDAPAVGYLTIKLQNSTWYKCLNRSLTGSRTYVCTYTHSYRRTYIRTYVPTYACTENQKTICPRHHPMRGHKNVINTACDLFSRAIQHNGCCTFLLQKAGHLCILFPLVHCLCCPEKNSDPDYPSSASLPLPVQSLPLPHLHHCLSY